jgi:Arc/MetJ-type ribon-helix-helix transcriptional regulator
MSQIAVRLSENELTGLDAAVAEGSYSSRADAVRAGIKLLERELREARIARSYRMAYAGAPPTDEETRMLDDAAARVGAALAGDVAA